MGTGGDSGDEADSEGEEEEEEEEEDMRTTAVAVVWKALAVQAVVPAKTV